MTRDQLDSALAEAADFSQRAARSAAAGSAKDWEKVRDAIGGALEALTGAGATANESAAKRYLDDFVSADEDELAKAVTRFKNAVEQAQAAQTKPPKTRAQGASVEEGTSWALINGPAIMAAAQRRI